MDWLVLWFLVEFGVVPNGNAGLIPVPEGGVEIYEDAYAYTDLRTELEILDTLYVGGSVLTRFWKLDPFRFAPDFARYSIEGGVRWELVDVGIRHECYHPIISAAIVSDQIYGGNTTLFIKVTNRRGW